MAPSHRLLWRGSLSHPVAPLDGIAFIAHLPSPSPPPAKPSNVLASPIALALETLRGRPVLPVLGTWEGHAEIEDGIRMHVNPADALSVAYLTRLFCSSLPPSQTSVRKCLRISIGDSPGNADELLLVPSPSTDDPTKIEILVGRKRELSPNVKGRLPRPDDPLPRRVRDLRMLAPLNPKAPPKGVKRPFSPCESAPSLHISAVENDSEEAAAKRKRVAGPPAGNASLERPPLKRKITKSGHPKTEKENAPQPFASPHPALPDPSTSSSDPSGLEELNKAVIKKLIVSVLSSAGCSRSHPEFKDCFSTINRGVAFALRKQLKMRKVDRDEVYRLIAVHVGMYFIPSFPMKERSDGDRPGEIEEPDGWEA